MLWAPSRKQVFGAMQANISLQCGLKYYCLSSAETRLRIKWILPLFSRAANAHMHISKRIVPQEGRSKISLRIKVEAQDESDASRTDVYSRRASGNPRQ